MADRLTEVRDALAAAITARLADPPEATVSTRWTFTVDRVGPESPNRVVFVLAAGDTQVRPATRGHDLNEYRIVVYTIEPYTGDGDPPDDWVDERCEWVTATVGYFGNHRRTGTRLLNTLWPETARRTVAADPGALSEHKLFWSEFEFTYREPAVA